MGGMTVEMAEERLSGLKVKYQQALDGANALYGAVQDCEWFLEQMKAKDPETEEIENVS